MSAHSGLLARSRVSPDFDPVIVANDDPEYLPACILTLPYPISANRYWRTAARGHRVMTYVSDEAKAFKTEVYARCLEAGIRHPIKGRVSVEVQLFPARPKDWERRSAKSKHWDDGVRCLDLDNANKVLLDALKGIAFEDDVWVRKLGSERMEPDEHGARMIVAIRGLP